MSKLGPKCQYFVWPPLFSSTALTLLVMEFTRASQVATGVLFHSSMTTSRSWWMLETLRSSTFRLRMPHRCSIGFRSGDMLGQSITFTLSFFSKAVVILEVCLGSLSCWNTALRPSLSGLDLNGWVILRGQQIYTVIQAVHSLLYIVAKCHFFSVVTWKDIIKYLQKCEG